MTTENETWASPEAAYDKAYTDTFAIVYAETGDTFEADRCAWIAGCIAWDALAAMGASQ